MENPNVSVNLRRHNSLPAHRTSPPSGKTRRFTSHRNRIAAKSNPYVGWFRHSPPISSFSGRQTREHPWQCWEKCQSGLGCQREHGNFGQQSFTSALHQNSSPYVGWFRHAPSCNGQTGHRRDMLSEYLDTELSLLLRAIPTPDCHGLLRLSDLLCSGQLAGGAPTNGDWPRTRPRSSSSPDFAYASLTEHVLRRMTCWLLTPFLQSAELKLPSKACHIEGEDASFPHEDGSLSSGDPLDDDCSCCSSLAEASVGRLEAVGQSENVSSSGANVSQRRPSSSSSSTSMMVSSQAEAYYAHHAVSSPGSSYSTLRNCNVYESTPGLDDSSNSGGGGFLGRLDYNITQMDIVRMTRNASRHLDVESILKLPTVTYHEEEEVQKSKQLMSKIDEDKECTDAILITTSSSRSRRIEEEGSWLIVHQDSAAPNGMSEYVRSEAKTNKNQKKDSGCVICLEQFKSGDRLRVLPCGHNFHMGCIDRWLSGSHSFEECYTAGCPTCKKHPCQKEEDDNMMLSTCSDGSVPSWAFSRIGKALAREALRKQAS